MAQSLEKAFLQKVAQMPQEELELPPPPPRSKPVKSSRKGKHTGEHRDLRTCRSGDQTLTLLFLPQPLGG